MDGLGDVLQGLFAAVGEGGVKPIADVLVDTGGDGDAARFGDLLQAGGDIDAVAQDVFALDDNIAQIDADAKGHALVFIDVLVASGHARLNFQHAAGGVDHGRKFQLQPIAHCFDDPATVVSNLRVDKFGSMNS